MESAITGHHHNIKINKDSFLEDAMTNTRMCSPGSKQGQITLLLLYKVLSTTFMTNTLRLHCSSHASVTNTIKKSFNPLSTENQ